MLTVTELTSIARARLKDADALFSKRRYDGAAYICGYAVEVALKARIVKTLKWAGFPADGGEFKGLESLKTHNLRLLARLSGWDAKIKAKFLAEWLAISQWNPESRYQPVGNVMQGDAKRMIESARKIVGALL
ncbi:MAG TPA: HEPN domain-containing protein [Tepidisphaeraceae bacterium]|jgi:HEPN domain-containing protein